MISISPLTGIPSTGSSTSDSAGKGKQYQPRQGQIFKAVVLEGKSSNTFVLDIGGRSISAHAQLPLSVGQTLQLQVESTSPQIELRILSDSANLFSGKAITLLGNSLDLQNLLQTLRAAKTSTFTSLSAQSQRTLESFFQFTPEGLSSKDAGGLLKQLIDRLGMSFEALLFKGKKEKAQLTLKSALLDLAQAFKGADKLAEATNKLLNTIELYQLAQLQLDKENLFIFPLPVPFLEKGYLLVEKDGSSENTTEDNGQNFSLHLALEGLGNLRVDLQKTDGGLFIRFVSDSVEKLQFIKKFTDDLLLNMVNTTILGISFSLDQVDPAADLLKRLLPDGESIVNTKV